MIHEKQLRAFDPAVQGTVADINFTRIEQGGNEQMIGLLDWQGETLAVRRLRQWGMVAARPSIGETAVDVGCGTGAIARRLAKRVGRFGCAVGVEPNAEIRSRAVSRNQARGSTASIVDGRANALPFPDASVDVVWCERLLQHLDDPQGAVNEFARVLRPGGRAIVLN